MLGNMKPLLRCGPIGNVSHGAYTMGTPLNSTRVPRPVPLRERVSSSICRALSCQETSSIGQVVNVTSSSVTLLSPSTRRLLAEPRALRSGSSNSAPSKLAPSAGEKLPLLPRTTSAGSEYSTPPSTFTSRLVASSSRWSAVMRRLPCCMTTFPDSTMAPSMVYCTLSPVISVGVFSGSTAGAVSSGGSRSGRSSVRACGGGQGGSSACAVRNAGSDANTRPKVTTLIEVTGTVCALYLYECSSTTRASLSYGLG